MASVPEIREANEQERLIALLPPEIAEKVTSGEYYVVPGKRLDKPWVRRSDNHRAVQGQSPNVPASKETGERTGLKQTASYREALETFLPMFETDAQKLSFQRLVEKVMWGVEGYPQEVRFPCPHPEHCNAVRNKGGDHVVSFVSKPDLATGFKLIELLAGRAAQTINQNIKSSSVSVELEHRTFDVRLYDMSTQTAEQRKEALIEAGVIEREWLEKVIDVREVASDAD